MGRTIVFRHEYYILPGLDAIHFLTQSNAKLSVYMEDHDGISAIANYSTFYIDEANAGYTLHVSRKWG